MLVTIRQTKSSGQNLFHVEEQGQLLFQAQTPWADLRLPLEAEKIRRLTFSDAQGQPLYHPSYQLLDNILRSLTKYKFLLGTGHLGQSGGIPGLGRNRPAAGFFLYPDRRRTHLPADHLLWGRTIRLLSPVYRKILKRKKQPFTLCKKEGLFLFSLRSGSAYAGKSPSAAGGMSRASAERTRGNRRWPGW